MFHVYYPIRRIIFNLKAPLLTAQSWNALDNSLDAKSYEQICEEFNVGTNTDWRQRLDANGSLGLIFTISPAHGTHHSRAFHIMLTKCRSYSISQMVLQDQAWSVSMIQSAHIAGQSLVLNLRSNRISSVSAAHLVCRSNVSPSLKTQSKVRPICPARLPDIKMHQYACSKIDNVFGFGLYMAPSDMELRKGKIEGYNNKIILSTYDQKLWWDAAVNLPANATSYSGDVSGTKTRKSTPHTTPHTTSTGAQKSLKLDISPAVQG